MKTKFIGILGLLCLLVAAVPPAGAQLGPSGPQDVNNPSPVLRDEGNSYRFIATTPSYGQPISISSGPENASYDGTTTTILGIDNYRGRYVVNLCTTSRMNLVPVAEAPESTGAFRVFRATYTIILASAPASATGDITTTVGGTNATWIWNQSHLYAIWDSGAARCLNGASVMEQFYLPPRDNGLKRQTAK